MTDQPKTGLGTLQDILLWTLCLDLRSLLSEINEEETKNSKAFPAGARIGHIHLRVTNLERSIKFYHEELKLDITLNWKSMGAAFLSAGGYHHHVRMNTWHSMNGEGHSDNVIGLENFTITIPDMSSFNRLRSAIKSSYVSSTKWQREQKSDENQFIVSDPDGIHIVIRSRI